MSRKRKSSLKNRNVRIAKKINTDKRGLFSTISEACRYLDWALIVRIVLQLKPYWEDYIP